MSSEAVTGSIVPAIAPRVPGPVVRYLGSPPGAPGTAGTAGTPGGPPPCDAARPGPGGPDTQAMLVAELAEERHIVLELQRAILPLHDEPYDLPGLRAVVRYLPASRASRVGGDWYITADMPDERVLIAIGDVGGHGLEAAAGMARLRGALAGLAITGAPPDRLVGWLNDLVCHVGPEHTASVAAGYFDPATRELSWSQAGHLPPVLVRGAWAMPLDPPAGVLLGAGRQPYHLATLQLLPRDLLILYSDGLVERRGQPLDAGIAKLVNTVRGIADPEQAVSAALRALSLVETDDDACVLALSVQ